MTEDKKFWKDRKSWISIARVVFATVFLLAAVFFLRQISSLSWLGLANLAITILCLMLAIIAVTLIIVPYKENRVFDRLGKLVIKRRGPRFVIPVIYRYVGSVPPGQMQASIQLFPEMEEKNTWIDAAIGGSLNFVDLRLWFMFVSDEAIEEVFQKIIDLLERLREEGEHAVRSAINATPIDEIVPSNVAKESEESEREAAKKKLQDFLFNAVEESSQMGNFLSHINGKVKVTSVTLGDYTLHPEVQGKRKERFDSAIDVEIADNLSETDRKKIGQALAKIREELIKGGFPKKEAYKAVVEIFRDKQAGSNLRRVTWTTEGGEKKILSPEGISEILTAVKEIAGIQREAGKKEESEGDPWVK